MKTWSVLPVPVLGFLLVALFLFFDCNGPPTNDQFGGAFSFGGERMSGVLTDFEKEKKEDFRCYEELGLSLSQAVKLDDVLFEKSIMQNKNLPYGDKRQQYNYVILQDEIIVAEWTATAGADLQTVLAGAKNVDEECKDRKCNEKSRRNLELGDPKDMINFFPEDSKTGLGLSPCWLDSDNKKGLLDAISKHLMLAQGEGKTIGNFNVRNWGTEGESDWMLANVAYAGEIIVDLVSCTYSMNNNSGTYAPKGDKLAEVAKHFEKTIGVGPFSYVNRHFDKNGVLESREIRSTDNLRTEISNAPPRCP